MKLMNKEKLKKLKTRKRLEARVWAYTDRKVIREFTLKRHNFKENNRGNTKDFIL